MKLEGYKLIFVAVGIIGILLIATPALIDVISVPERETFSELYLLGPSHMAANYPFNIAVNRSYSVYAGVGNQLGNSAYYVLYVKFGNATDKMPNATLGTPSPLQPLYEYRFSLQNGKNLETLLTFSVSNATISGNNSQINTLQINGVAFNLEKPSRWNSNSTTFEYQLFFELWVYNEKTRSVDFNNRYVDLQLNLTRAHS